MYIMNAKDFVDVERNVDFVNEKLYGAKLPKVKLVALAIMAQKINGEYCKRGGKSDFVEVYDEEADDVVQRFVKVKESNRTVMEILAENDSLITMDVMQEAQEMLSGLEMDYMFKVLGDDMNDFETSIQRFLAEDDNDVNVRYHIGIVAYIPAYVEREAKQRDLAEQSIGSEWIGKVGEAVDLEIEIISKRGATAWYGWNINAITKDGNRISFFTGKENIANREGMFKVSAKVKDHGRVWRDESTKETRINYVKLI
jgi:hypothetical protein